MGILKKGNYEFYWILSNDGEVYGSLKLNGETIESGYYRTDSADKAFNGALSRTFIKVKGK